jgi:omega-6 fatty acid desaturase (delta-12 desaturase)
MKSAMLPNWPTKKEILGVVPEHCMVKDTAKSMVYAVLSTAMTVGCGLAAYAWLPLQAAWTPAWIAYALVTGTVATGAWVVAHECGHGAFSDNKTLQDTVGYILHTVRSFVCHHCPPLSLSWFSESRGLVG